MRSVIGTGGQRVDASDRLYLAEAVPVLIIWGARDPIIPAHHGEDAHRNIPGSRLEVFEGVGHLPQLEAPSRFVAVLEAVPGRDRAGAVRPRGVASPVSGRLGPRLRARGGEDRHPR